MHIYGEGTVDGFHADLSSAQGEIQGQTALVIMSTKLLQSQDNPTLPVIFHGDNQGGSMHVQMCIITIQ